MAGEVLWQLSPVSAWGGESLPAYSIVGFHCDGGLAEAVRVPRSSLLPIADNVSGDLACLAEPLACALNALEQAQLCAGEKCSFMAGAGGLMMALVAQSLGAEPLILETIVENSANRSISDAPRAERCSAIWRLEF